VQILIRDGRHADDSLAPIWRNRTTRTLRRDLREVTREIRPDWDLSAPGLRATWDAADRARHYPYRQVDHTRSPAEALPDADHNATVRSEYFKVFFPERGVVPLLRQEAPTMEYLVTMTTHVPDGTSEEAVSDVRAREAVRSRELVAQGHLLRLWRPPLQPGEWRTLGLFAAGDDGQLEKVLASMPLRVWRTDEVTPLSPHRNDPGPGRTCRRSARSS
jgi:muconolactone delta-isomerase